MNSISQNMRFRESLLKYTERHGVREAMRRYDVHKSYIYRWRKRWLNGDKKNEALADISKRPKSSPTLHTPEEEKLIRNLCRRNPDIGLMDLYYKLQARGYKRSPSGLFKALKRLNLETSPTTLPSPTYKPKPYEQMHFPGERIQIDVKHVPVDCLHPLFKKNNPGMKLYQYTAIDEFSRIRYLEGFIEVNTYTSTMFLISVVSYFKSLGIEVKCIQTDNGPEFTKRFLSAEDPANNLSLMERTARKLGIKVKHIRPHTPRHNGKVERSHREDQKLLYAPIMKPKSKRKFSSLKDFNNKLRYHMNKTNNRPMRPLGFQTPLQYLEEFKKKETKKK